MSEISGGGNEGKSFPQIISEKLMHLKTNFKDEIPEEVLHSNSKKPNNIKARRGGWLGPVVTYLELGVFLGEIVDPQIEEDITSFTQFYTSDKFRQQKLTYEEDIKIANRMIDLYLQNCKTKQLRKA
jgi:hypothetical protein